MPAKRYPVILDQSQRDSLLELISSGTGVCPKTHPGQDLIESR